MHKIGVPVFAFVTDGCTTTCMMMIALGRSPKGTPHWPTVLLFSKIFPAFISLMSLAPLGAIFLSKTYQNNIDSTLESTKTTFFYLDLCFHRPNTIRVRKQNISKFKDFRNRYSDTNLSISTLTIYHNFTNEVEKEKRTQQKLKGNMKHYLPKHKIFITHV